MTRNDNSLADLIAQAERLGDEQKEIDERNRKRRAKGRKPLPDVQERKDMEVGRRRYRTGDSTTVDAADAMKLFELRKAEMSPDVDDPDDIDDDNDIESIQNQKQTPLDVATKVSSDDETEAAIRAAESARRVQDMKGGRIDHAGNWSKEGQKLEGGDKTSLVSKSEIEGIWGNSGASESSQANEDESKKDSDEEGKKPAKSRRQKVQSDFAEDLYKRLGTSFEALERSISDLQGRVSEIVTASTPKGAVSADGQDEFQKLLERKTPIVFDVGGTKMTFDAICVFHAPPCITVVSKIGSAKITPKPGAQLFLSYEMDGTQYENDPVTFLGTRFDLPMFGLSFVGFIRDRESDMIDAAAGVSE